MAALARSIHPDTEVCYVVPGNLMSMSSLLFGNSNSEISKSDISKIAQHLALSDIVAFSSMTSFSELTKTIILAIKEAKPDTYIVWGGIHPIVDPDDAVKFADAVCVGEGEIAFRDFLYAYKKGDDYTHTKNFWFNKKGLVTKNDFYPLQTKEEMDGFPLPLYAENELVYKNSVGFVPMGVAEYRFFNGIAYHTVWSIGCPFTCSYCSNTKFIENDINYRKVRHSSVQTIIREVKEVLKKHPYISSVTFHDDSFIGLSVPTLEEFSKRWREEINISFSVLGILPGLVKKQKMEILVKAGMYRVKMGMQSGSDRMLKFFERPATVLSTKRAMSIIAEFNDYMIPPTYDIILDSPNETKQDVIDTLRFIYEMPRPFNLNMFSLRLMPNTNAIKQFFELGIEVRNLKDKCYTKVDPSIANILVYIIDIFRPPERLFEFFLKFVEPTGVKQKEFPIMLMIVRTLYMFKRGLNHIRYLEFSYFPGLIGNIGYIFGELGILKYWHRHVLKLRT